MRLAYQRKFGVTAEFDEIVMEWWSDFQRFLSEAAMRQIWPVLSRDPANAWFIDLVFDPVTGFSVEASDGSWIVLQQDTRRFSVRTSRPDLWATYRTRHIAVSTSVKVAGETEEDVIPAFVVGLLARSDNYVRTRTGSAVTP